MKKFFAKIASVLPEILMFISVFLLTFSLIFGAGESAKYETKAETLATENNYLKEEIKWYQTQLGDFPHDTAPSLPDAAEGGTHE